jgi:hypothetical protein
LGRDGADAAVGLGVLDAAVTEGAADVEDARFAVDVAVLEREPFARPRPVAAANITNKRWVATTT